MRATSYLLLIPVLFLGACSIFDSTPDKPRLAGERISILDLQREIVPGVNEAAIANIDIPIARNNPDWPQNGGYPHHAMQNLELGAAEQLERIWSSKIGKGTTKKLPLTAQPVVAAGKVFTLDTTATVTAFHNQTGKKIWQADVRHLTEKGKVISGGIAFDENVLYVTSGYAEVLALSAENGNILWRTTISAGSRAAPTIKNGRVFVTALNNNTVALEAQTGRILWEYEGVEESTGLLGAASPAADDQLVIAAFSSGDLAALRVENGSVIWDDSLANSLRLGGIAGLSDIRGLPVINGNVAIAVSYGGKIIAFEKRNGNRLWQQEISSAETPWVAGNTVYVLTADYKIIALDLTSGNILWVSEIQKYEDPEDREDLISWTGPLMVSGRLMAVASNGTIIEFNPKNGAQLTQWDAKKDIRIAPVVAGGTLYLLAEDGSLLAYR